MGFNDSAFNTTPFNEGGEGAGAVSVRDDDLFKAIIALLGATGAFDGLHYPSLPEDQGQPASEGKMAVLEPLEGNEPVEIFDDGSSEVRQVRYRLTLMFRDPDPEVCARELDRLFSIAANSVNGKSLLGATFPDTTRLRKSTWNRRTAPEQKLVCTGEFQYLIEGWQGHDTTP